MDFFNDQDFFNLLISLRRRTLTSSDTDLYPSSGCSSRSFSASRNRGSGILAELYRFAMYVTYMTSKLKCYVTYMSQTINRSITLQHICNKRVRA